MPVSPEDRPLDALREQTVDQLIVNYGHGALSLDAFQHRLDQAFDATRHGELTRLTADLELPVDPGYIAQKDEELGFHYDGENEADAVDTLVNILSGGERSGEWTAAAEIRVINVLGGSTIDFSNARFARRVTRVRVLCICGGVDIRVPDGASTTVQTFNLLGGVTNKAPTHHDPTAPKIIVEGLVLLGGLDVRVKRPLKERMLEFARNLRTLFDQAPHA